MAIEPNVPPPFVPLELAAAAFFQLVAFAFPLIAGCGSADTLQVKRQLIEALTRRLFNHVEHGINVPGPRLEEARRAFEVEHDQQRKRVKGAMLAGALFNRVTDIFEAMPMFSGIGSLVRAFAAAARLKCETLRTEGDIFEIWTSFVVSTEQLVGFEPRLSAEATVVEERWASDGMMLELASSEDRGIGRRRRPRVRLAWSDRLFWISLSRVFIRNQRRRHMGLRLRANVRPVLPARVRFHHRAPALTTGRSFFLTACH